MASLFFNLLEFLGGFMNISIVNHAFLIKAKLIYDKQKRIDPNSAVNFFVADLVGSYDWDYPFDTVYAYYEDVNRPQIMNWNVARTQIGKLFVKAIPEIEKELNVKITSFTAHRKGHLVNCYNMV